MCVCVCVCAGAGWYIGMDWAKYQCSRSTQCIPAMQVSEPSPEEDIG